MRRGRRRRAACPRRLARLARRVQREKAAHIARRARPYRARDGQNWHRQVGAQQKPKSPKANQATKAARCFCSAGTVRRGFQGHSYGSTSTPPRRRPPRIHHEFWKADACASGAQVRARLAVPRRGELARNLLILTKLSVLGTGRSRKRTALSSLSYLCGSAFKKLEDTTCPRETAAFPTQ